MPVTGIPIASAIFTATGKFEFTFAVTVVDRSTLVQICGAANPQPSAFRQHVVVGPPGLAHGAGLVPASGGMRLAASGRGAAASLCLDQFEHRVLTGSDHLCGLSDGGRDDLAVDHHQAQVVAARPLLDQHLGQCYGSRECRVEFVGSVHSTVMPLPCSPRVGLTTTSPTSSRNCA